MSIGNLIDQAARGQDTGTRFDQLVRIAARDGEAIDPPLLAELVELARARGLPLRSSNEHSLEKEIAAVAELAQQRAELKRLESGANPDAPGALVEFDQETERLVKELKEKRKPQREKLLQASREEEGRRTMAMDCRRRISELNQAAERRRQARAEAAGTAAPQKLIIGGR